MDIERIGNPLAARLLNDAIARQSQVGEADSKLRAAPRARPEHDRPMDGVEISDRARELARALRAVHAAPDVRADRVAEIKQRIENGTYQVSAELLAHRLLGDDGRGG